MDKLHRIYRDIKGVRIQGATNIAKAALGAYFLRPDEKNKKALLGLRPTEPMLSNVLRLADKWPEDKIMSHFPRAQEKMNMFVLKLIKNGIKIYTHCHSTNVVKALIYAHNKGKKFEVFNTETRPLLQGRITAKELAKHGIKVTTFEDSAIDDAIEESDLILIGADAILKTKVINKVGSGAIADIAFVHRKPLYVVADSWKFSPKSVKIEERDFHEVWKRAPKHVIVRNPAFEKVDKKYLKAIISEYGILKFDDFLRKVHKSA